MLAAIAAAGGNAGAHDQRQVCGVAIHVATLGDLVEELVRGDEGEVRGT